MRSSALLLHLMLLAPAASAQSRPAPPDDFPQFIVPGHESSMTALRELYYLHYRPPAGLLATLWDDWMSGPTLWPAVATQGRMDALREAWRKALSGRYMDPEGYVATHQHPSIAHQHGWPFPFWGDVGTWGCHFSLQHVPRGWHGTAEQKQTGWQLVGGKDLAIGDFAWNAELTEAGAAVRTPPVALLPERAPFIQLRWRAEGLEQAQPYLEWTTEDDPEFSPARRFHFSPVSKGQSIVYTMIPVFRSPAWKGQITRLGINFDNRGPAKVGIQALFTQYDTRHNVNNQCFIRGCCKYFWWTRDLNLLGDQLPRMRLGLKYLMVDLGGEKEKCILAPYVGHDGRPGFVRKPDGTKEIHAGHGIGHNYWDILPNGYRDTFATIYYYDTLRAMARLEADIASHPEWNLPTSPLRFAPEALLRHAEEVKTYANQHFWSHTTERFTLGLDADGKSWDYGFTMVNCEAIHHGLATPKHAEAIMSWLTGERIVEGDTAQGADIYHWRFAPRATTKRNLDWYCWCWQSPESIPFGGQVQDGGAVLGFSYHDLMSRLKLRGPENAWERLRAITRWFDEVQAAGGYREYYKDGKRGTTLQGGGTAGGLGLDAEFFESILVPQVMLDGFLGFEPRADGFAVEPKLPKSWPELTITQIHLHRLMLAITAKQDGTISIDSRGACPWPMFVYLPPGRYQVSYLDASGKPAEASTAEVMRAGQGVAVRLGDGTRLMLTPG
ncbi:MAG: hypothetical protein HY718_05435 [Planctomycetes bacterium]|nr:hypothetical protein [Planctomycetota bacterium]